MSEQSLRAFINRVATELGITIKVSHPAGDVASLPPAVQPLYSVTDGLDLPFAEFNTTAQLRTNAKESYFGQKWLAFGFDGEFTHFLVSTDPNHLPPIAAFDPEVEDEPESSYDSVLELLEDEYSLFVENERHYGDLHVTAIPAATSLPTVVQELKRLATIPTHELLKRVRTLPLILDCVNAASGIVVVRELHALGVGASLRNVRPEDAG